MAEVVRRRYARVLLEARETNPDAAEFSQENPAEALERAAGKDNATSARAPAADVQRSIRECAGHVNPSSFGCRT